MITLFRVRKYAKRTRGGGKKGKRTGISKRIAVDKGLIPQNAAEGLSLGEGQAYPLEIG